jgi:hypothetical protein
VLPVHLAFPVPPLCRLRPCRPLSPAFAMRLIRVQVPRDLMDVELLFPLLLPHLCLRILLQAPSQPQRFRALPSLPGAGLL